MNANQQIEFKLSKSKIILMFFGCLIFCILSILFILNPDKFTSWRHSSSTMFFIVGILGVAFFGICLLFYAKKMFDNTPGLIVNDKGIYDNASGISAGFIPWQDIEEIKETIVVNQSYINIVVKNPDEYIKRQKNIFKRKLVQMNYNSFGTVIGIPSVTINSDFNELKRILEQEFEKHKKS
ncbi:MAG: hypothetical protein KAZ71_08315 [Bacteroidia bacterium]|nr:hypothetical protein [Bacteroidia bacterium]